MRLPRTRNELIAIFDEIEPWPAAPLSWKARVDLLSILMQIIDQMPPRRDTRLKLLPRQIAMLAMELEKRGISKKLALLRAMEFWAPNQVQNAAYRLSIERVVRRIRREKDPGRGMLLSPPAELINIVLGSE